MATLIEVARKGRAFGISVIVGTQHPATKVIDAQIKANLPTAIAFQARTDVESRVILGRKGAEDLNRPGLALTFVNGRWETVQTLRVEPNTLDRLITEQTAVKHPALTDIEQALIQYATENLDGAFIINSLYTAFRGRISKRRLTSLAQQWEQRGWLTTLAHATDPRRVTDELLALIGPLPDTRSDDRVTGMTGDDRNPKAVTGSDALELPPFLDALAGRG